MQTYYEKLHNRITSLEAQYKKAVREKDFVVAREAATKALEISKRVSEDAQEEIYIRTMYRDHSVTWKQRLEWLKEHASATVASSSDTKEEEDGKPAFTAETDTERITFDDVAGLDEVKDQIKFHVLEPLNNPELAAVYGIKPGAKVLMWGPPGVGKTFIARAIAGEVKAAFFAVNCQDLISKYMGESSKQLDKLFEEAQKNEKAIIFFDEIDSIASKRGDGTSGADGEMARFVATFLTKVDGFKKSKTNKMLLLIAASNRPWALDPAMTRGGRFETQIYVNLPDQAAREFMVNKALKDIPRDADVDLTKLARALDGFGGGDIVAICDRIRLEAYKRTVRTGTKQNITRDDCNNVLRTTRNNITPEEMAKYEAYRRGEKIK